MIRGVRVCNPALVQFRNRFDMLPIGVHSDAEALLCPIRMVLSKVTGKWQIIIVLALADEPLRFSALKRTIGDVTQRVLTENLRNLQRDGYLTRTVSPGPPVAVSYELTELGQELVALLKPIVFWAKDNIETVKAARRDYETPAR
ncbi:MAG: helix-turn-helix domain-containing protein [Pseudomonadota bacterium]